MPPDYGAGNVECDDSIQDDYINVTDDPVCLSSDELVTPEINNCVQI